LTDICNQHESTEWITTLKPEAITDLKPPPRMMQPPGECKGNSTGAS